MFRITGSDLEVALPPDTIDLLGVHGVLQHRARHCVGVDVKSLQVDGIKGVAGQVVAGIVLVARVWVVLRVL